MFPRFACIVVAASVAMEASHGYGADRCWPEKGEGAFWHGILPNILI